MAYTYKVKPKDMAAQTSAQNKLMRSLKNIDSYDGANAAVNNFTNFVSEFEPTTNEIRSLAGEVDFALSDFMDARQERLDLIKKEQEKLARQSYDFEDAPAENAINGFLRVFILMKQSAVCKLINGRGFKA